MKKYIAIVLCLAMLAACLVGCAPKEQDALIGSWSGNVDLSDAINADFAQDENLAPHMHISGFRFQTTMTFYRNGTYSMQVDRSELEAVLESLVQQLSDGMEKYLEELVKELALDMTVEEYLSSVGLSLEDLFADAYTEETIDKMLSDLEAEGNFLVEEGKLFLSQSKQYAVNPNVWELYTVEGDKLTIDVSSEEADNPYAQLIYPMVFTRIVEEE